MTDDNKHFDRIADGYHRAANATHQVIYDQVAELITPLIANKVVVDIGNGGKFAYDVSSPSQVIAMDVSQNMLDMIKEPNVTKLLGDAREMAGIDDDSVDVLVFQLVLHHIAGRTPLKTFAMLRQTLATAKRKLRHGGHLVITETLTPEPLLFIERLLFPLTFFILKRSGVGMIFFYSRRLIQRAIFEAFGAEATVSALGISGWLDPFPGSFPGLIKVPAWSLPVRFACLIVQRP